MVIINKKFNSLDIEKQERIINAALREFAQNGFEKASTNEIIKEADISKGSLFNYFNSKKDLYFYLFQYVDVIINQIYDEIDYNETDLFNRMRQVGLIKFKIMLKYPNAFDFLKTAANETAAEVKSEIDKLGKDTIENGIERICKNIDWSKFREDIDLQKTMNIINWTILSFSELQRNRLNSYENVNKDLLAEWEDYFDIMKRCFYKKEAQ